jgi:hypothetical protein
MGFGERFSANVSMKYVRRLLKEPISLNLPSVNRKTGVPESGHTMTCAGGSLATVKELMKIRKRTEYGSRTCEFFIDA